MIKSKTTLISVCHPKHIKIWKITSKHILKYIKADNYIVVVPDKNINDFNSYTHPKFEIISENNLLINFNLDKLRLKIDKNRISWYKQQFIKLELLFRLKSNEKAILWDADTIPFKNLEFFSEDGSLIFYPSHEFHSPYFIAINKLLGMNKIIKESFISQCFPITYEISSNFFRHIESHNSTSWYDAVIECIGINETSGFSEFESIGTFITHNYFDLISWHNSSWSRLGYNELKKNGLRFNQIENNNTLLSKFDYLSFEKWENMFDKKKKLINCINLIIFSKKFINYFILFYKRKLKKTLEKYIDNIILTENDLLIVQIGANDGIQNDPIRKYLKSKGNYNAILVEPLPFFVDSLNQLYNDRNDIKVIQAAAGEKNDNQILYYIPNHIALNMNGNGPHNNWALGQGSFYKDNVVFWIYNNSFRGDDYKKNIKYWIENISEVNVSIIATKNLIPVTSKIIFLIIDVQGFEIDVLKGIDWNYPPKYIIIEEDLNNMNAREYLLNKGYILITNCSNNLLFVSN
jgi:FkbM family methyltransferase